jgi:hypothetical protein
LLALSVCADTIHVVTFWDDDVFDSHPVWGQVDALASYLDDERLPKDLDPMQRASVVRLKTALELLREHQQKGLKIFYTKSMFDQVEATLCNQVNSNLASFVNDSATYGNTVNDAAVHVEDVFTYVAQWPALPPGGQAQAAGRAFSEYKKEAETALEALTDRNTDLEAALVQLKSQMTAVESQMTTVEERYGTSLAARDEEYSDAIGRIEESGKAAYDKAIADDIGERVKVLDSHSSTAVMVVAGINRQSDEARELVKSCKDSADFIAKKAIATDFGRQARRKSLAGVAYEVAGIAIGGGTIIMLLRHYLSASAATSDNVLAVGLARFSVTVGLFVIAGYLLSRGASNHRQARASKSADIRLQTLEAFISKLDPGRQDEIRSGMAENIFLHGRLADDDRESTWRIPEVLGGRSDKKSESAEDAEPVT